MGTAKKLLRNPTSLMGVVLLIFFVMVALLAPWLAPPRPNSDPYQIPRAGFSSIPKSPSSEHLFGRTEGQYDIYYGVIWGARSAFRVGVLVSGCVAIIGLIVGTSAAYFGGLFDEVIMRIVDIFLSFPFLIAAMTIASILGRSLTNVMISLIVFGWMYYARLVRSEVLAVKQLSYVEAARSFGGGHFWIICRHILPNSIYPILVRFTMDIGAMVVWAAALSFLGVGAPIGYADWGQLINLARNWIVGPPGSPLKYWYTVVYPSGALVLFVLAWNLVGDTLRDIFDPKMRV